MLRIEARNLRFEDWDSILVSHIENGSWYQTTHYNEDMRTKRFEELFYLRQWQGNSQLAAQAIVRLTHPYEWGFYRRGWTKLTPRAMKLFPVLLCNQAPSIIDQTHGVEIYQNFANWVSNEGNKIGCAFAKLTPAYYQKFYVEKRHEIRTALELLGYRSTPKATLIVDLKQDEDTLFSNLKKEARNKVRKAQKQGVEIIEVGTEDSAVSQLCHIMSETSMRNGVPALTIGDLKNSQWFKFQKSGFFRAFVSLHNGNLVSSQMALIYNGAITLGGVSYTDYSRKNGIYGNDLMQWHMIKWGRKMGLSTLDFAGIEPYSSSPKMRAIYDFKTKWGGEQVDYDEFVFEFSNVKSLLFRSLNNKVGTKLKKMFRFF